VNEFPGPTPTLPFIGNILLFACKPEGTISRSLIRTSDQIKQFCEGKNELLFMPFLLEIGTRISNWFANHGKVFRFWMLDAPQIFIADANLAKVSFNLSYAPNFILSLSAAHAGNFSECYKLG
jgi:hypothetical protein